MPVSQVLLKVSPTNDISQAVSVDVTSDILTAGKTIYNVGAPNTTRWYFATLTDNAGNSSTFPLGSYTTAAASVQAGVTIEANRALVTSDAVYVSGSAGTVTGTDVALANAQNLYFKVASTPSDFTVGVRLKFANTTTFTGTNTSLTHHLILRVNGSTSGGIPVYFNMYNCTNSSSPFNVAVRWEGRGGQTPRQLVGEASAIMKTSYFWVFLTGTTSGAVTFRSFDTDDVTLTASSLFSGTMSAIVGDTRVQLLNQFGQTPANTVTVDKVWYKPAVDTAVTPASTVA